MRVSIHRFNPDEQKFWVDTYTVPTEGRDMTIMDILDYISAYLDPSLAYYKHSVCNHGICGRCALQINGKIALACITRVHEADDVLDLAPVSTRILVRDLVTKA